MNMGPPRCELTLRYGLAMGADRAIHICDERLENADPRIRSKALAKAIEMQGFDLILCGKKAIDDNGGVVGGFVAELLNLLYIPSVTNIIITPDTKRVIMYRVLEKGNRELIECDLPVLLSVEKGLTKTRYPTLTGRLISSKKEIVKIYPNELGLGTLLNLDPEIKFSKLSVSRPKPKRIFTPDSSLPPEEKIKLIMSGGVTEKRAGSLKGSPQELAKHFIDFLEENRIIKKPKH